MARLRTTGAKKVGAPVTRLEGSKNSFQQPSQLYWRTSGPTRRSTKGRWTAEEDELLCQLVQRYGGKCWKKIAEYFKDRTDVQCLHRWRKVLNPELIKGPWSKEEDEVIVSLVNKYGAKKWSAIAQALPGRIGKQCRERWYNHLDPAIKRDAWTEEEEMTLICAHEMYGNKWAKLTTFLPGRTDNAIKNHWNSSVKKKLEYYVQSGLLEQFQSSLFLERVNISCSMMQHRCEDNVGQLEETSESTLVPENFNHSELDPVAEYAAEILTMHKNLESSGMDRCQESESGSGISSGATIFPASLSTSDEPISSHAKSEHLAAIDGENSKPKLVCETTEGSLTNGRPTQLSNENDITGNENTSCFQSLLHAPQACASPKIVLQQTLELENVVSCREFINVDFTDGTGEKTNNAFEFDERRNDPELVPVDIFTSLDSEVGKPSPECHDLKTGSSLCADPMGNVPSMDDITTTLDEVENLKSPCLKAPCFPRLDVPFTTCLLTGYDDDTDLAYSPFGIRQLIMSSMNSSTPCNLCDSPSYAGSSYSILKGIDKPFACTSSVSKRRMRKFIMNPEVAEAQKGAERESKLMSSISSLSSTFSSLDATFDENGPSTNKAASLVESNFTTCNRKEDSMVDEAINDEDIKEKIKNLNSSIFKCDDALNDSMKEVTPRINVKAEQYVPETGKQLSSLADRDGEEATMQTVRDLESLSINQNSYNVFSPSCYENESERSQDSMELKGILESPSPWRSTLFMDSFIDNGSNGNELPLELQDPGYYLSPGTSSYNAIGLAEMKRCVGEVSINSENVLLSNPEMFSMSNSKVPAKVVQSRVEELNQRKSNFLHDEKENLPPGFIEGCFLDFGGSRTPDKLKDRPKLFSGTSISNQSPYLMKGCR